jgi:putative intracellular protease/amidase
MDPSSGDRKDPANARFLDSAAETAKMARTIPLADVDPSAYDAILFAGGHGTMWDFREDRNVQRLAAEILDRGGVVAAVCHGPAALVDVRVSSGEFLVARKRVTGFSNDEEEAAKLTKVVPFLLESMLIERGGRYEKAIGLWKEHVVTDGRLVTGQNPASAAGVGREVARLLAG